MLTQCSAASADLAMNLCLQPPVIPQTPTGAFFLQLQTVLAIKANLYILITYIPSCDGIC